LTAAQGKALNDKMLGVDQSWQNVTASRLRNTTYTNTTAKPIFLSISVRDLGNDNPLDLVVGNVVAVRLDEMAGSTAGFIQITAIVPAGQTYRLNTLNVLSYWAELR